MNLAIQGKVVVVLVLTGAGGFVGSQLIPLLSGPDKEPLLLVSRDPTALRSRFEDVECCNYDDLTSRNLTGCIFVHLAARNNDRPGTLAEFESANVDHLLRTARIARAGGAVCFINLTSSHALDPSVGDHYGQSKAEGARRLAAFWPDGAVNMYVPAVYGIKFQGRLAPLESLPRQLRGVTLSFLRLIKPVVSVDALAQAIRKISQQTKDGAVRLRGARFVADPLPAYSPYAVVRRTIDIVAALAIILLLGWMMLALVIWIKLDSKGPAIFAQRRIGWRGAQFTCYKFRTMKVGTREAGTHELAGDAVTRAGGLLRRTKLDELPQIINILRNEMSLVGPRPCLPTQSWLISERDQRGVLELKPGITGLAQIHHIDMSAPSTLANWDSRYHALRSLPLDFKIILRTVLGGGSGDRIAANSSIQLISSDESDPSRGDRL